jgi:hypothetical protein
LQPLPTPSPAISHTATAATPVDTLFQQCKQDIAHALQQPAAVGAPKYEAIRPEFLGEVSGEPMVFLAEPKALADKKLPESWLKIKQWFFSKPEGVRVLFLYKQQRQNPQLMRSILLRQGYVYTPVLKDAITLTSTYHVGDLFDEPEIWMQRGNHKHRLKLEKQRGMRIYRYVDGSRKGHVAKMLFGDRFTVRASELKKPLHVDWDALAQQLGFDRSVIEHKTQTQVVAKLRLGSTWVQALAKVQGATVKLSCLSADVTTRKQIESWQQANLPRKQLMLNLSEAITQQVDEGLRFDRPQGERGPDRDGQLRPVWLNAYLHKQKYFSVDEASYPVFNSSGQPWPPQVCVDFVLDTYDRAKGTWYQSAVADPARIVGNFDWDSLHIPNRRGVLAFGQFATKHPEHFEVRHFVGKERIQFGNRKAYFAFLIDHADEFRPGDILAIKGLKRDGRIHQHAILLEKTDPLTGMPYGLADQMKVPRRRSWEGIMAEAPMRSLFYRVRPGDHIQLAGIKAIPAPTDTKLMPVQSVQHSAIAH